MFLDSGNTFGGSFRTVNTPIRLVDTQDTRADAPPLLGANNEEILCSIGGLSPDELRQMATEGLV